MLDDYGFGKLPGDLYRRWPKGEDGEIVPPKFLTHCLSTDLEDTMLVNMLEAYGIPALRIHPGDGAFGKVVLGMSGTGSSIYVPETLWEDARALMIPPEGEAGGGDEESRRVQ